VTPRLVCQASIRRPSGAVSVTYRRSSLGFVFRLLTLNDPAIGGTINDT